MTFWKNKRVLLTGHTGFKGGWLSLWLQSLGAEVSGYSLDPPTAPSLFAEARVGEGMRSRIADIRDLDSLRRVFAESRPEIVLHLAAQPLVRASYEDPLTTYSTNVMGTANVLEAVRGCDAVRAVVVVTSDKCYENKEWVWGYRENDPLGGYDPYSSSKACTELVAAAYRNSFFPPERYSEHGVALATVRAGNVIGGGDWAKDRLVPDIMRAFFEGREVIIRNPRAVRPWQHVLEPLCGYLQLAERLYTDGMAFAESWNFGPGTSGNRNVESVVDVLAKLWGDGARWSVDRSAQPHEAQLLKLDCSKVGERLGWSSRLQLDKALQMTADWYKASQQGADMHEFTLRQINSYSLRVDVAALHATASRINDEQGQCHE